MEIPSEFFTIGSFATLAGLTGITFVVTNTLRVAFGFVKAWVGLVVALAATFAGQSLAGQLDMPSALVGFCNACLVFLTACGSAQVASAATSRPGPQSLDADEVRFFSSWI